MESRRKWKDTQVPLDTDHRDKLGLKGSISLDPVFFISAAHFPPFYGKGGSEGDGGEVLELTVRLGRMLQERPGNPKAVYGTGEIDYYEACEPDCTRVNLAREPRARRPL